MWDLIVQGAKIIWYYDKDKASGKPYWQDPAVIALVVSLIATEVTRYCGVTISHELQLQIVSAVTGIGMLISPHTGFVSKKDA